MIPKVYSTEEFEAEYTYEGSDLGMTWSPEKTFFRLWSPFAKSAKLRLYKTGNIGENDIIEEINMTADIRGTWVAEVFGDLNGIYYTFCVVIDGEEREAADPYAKAAGANGLRSMVIDLDSTDPEGWEKDESPWSEEKSVTDAVIYELHVRDLSSDESSGIEHKGKFLGVIEEGTKNSGGKPTGIDHIKDLGITHIHFLPSFDYGSVDESKPEAPQYNWGYDPMNFNIPEGSYATDAKNGAVRIREMKQMVQGLHKNGLCAVMDVVYNHVYLTEEFCFNRLVPGYFSREDENWNYSAGSGCGNDTASERSMVRKFIVDSVKYWAEEYHIDGFRFDLSGLLDVVTLNEVIVEVHKIRPSVIIYCEGWDMPTKLTKPGIELANQFNSHKMPGSAFFSDTIRDTLYGAAFKKEEGGFVSGKKGLEPVLKDCFLGMASWCKNPFQSINYVSCHDGLTLFDKLAVSAPKADFAERVRMNRLTAAIYILSQGVPLLHAGEEMLRSKPLPDGTFEHNSYNKPDSVNSIKWDDLEKPEYQKTFEYYKGLIRFRKNHGAFRLRNASDVRSHVTVIDNTEAGTAAFHLWGNINGEKSEAIYVVFNANPNELEIELPVGRWSICIDGENSGDEPLYTAEGKFTVPPISAVVMVK